MFVLHEAKKAGLRSQQTQHLLPHAICVRISAIIINYQNETVLRH